MLKMSRRRKKRRRRRRSSTDHRNIMGPLWKGALSALILTPYHVRSVKSKSTLPHLRPCGFGIHICLRYLQKLARRSSFALKICKCKSTSSCQHAMLEPLRISVVICCSFQIWFTKAKLMLSCRIWILILRNAAQYRSVQSMYMHAWCAASTSRYDPWGGPYCHGLQSCLTLQYQQHAPEYLEKDTLPVSLDMCYIAPSVIIKSCYANTQTQFNTSGVLVRRMCSLDRFISEIPEWRRWYMLCPSLS